MEKIEFTAPDTGEELELFVLEQTTVAGVNYLLVTESDDEDEEVECYILKEVCNDGTDELTYEFEEDDKILDSLANIFSELLEDTDIEM